ncbi:MAG: SprT-like domain-containing protein [Clostridiales bacterium]|nr:SprT-like domain-containing protein [Clostridiales bacterium]
MEFTINGLEWRIKYVDGQSKWLRRSDGSLTVGMTDLPTQTVYLSENLYGVFLRKVLCHELCHAFCFSFDIHMPIEQEEFMADWISLYGADLIYLLDDLMQNISWRVA